MNRPLVTVIVNCFNGAAFLRQAIESVIAQTWDNWEMVFWDNQSTDDSEAIVKSFKDPRIRYYYAPTHTLLYEARNYAIEKAEGEFLAFLDVDDCWLPEKLEQQIDLFRDPEVGIAYGNFWIENLRKGKRWIAYSRRLPEGYVLDRLLENYRVGLLTLMVRRGALPANAAPFDPRYHIIGDFDLVVRLAAKHKAACIQKPVGIYRVHGSNETSLRHDRHIAELERWCAEMSKDPVIGKRKAFTRVQEYTDYVRAIGALIKGHRQKAIKTFLRMPWGRLRFRLLIGLLLPLTIIRCMKN